MTATIIQGDAIEVMASLPDKSVGLVLCDPPYEVTRNHWDKIIPVEPMWRELWRICTGAVVLTAIQPFSSMLVMSQIDKFRHEWVWAKNKATGHLNANKAPLRSHEVALVFSGGACPYFPQMSDGHEPGHAAIRRNGSTNYGAQVSTSYGGSTQRYPKSVKHFDVVNNDDPERVHPTQKPADLFEFLVRTYSQPGETVLDFACGSGTTGVACRRADRDFIGIELDPKYAAIARDRIANDAGPLFAAA